MLDDDTYIGAEHAFNLFTVRKNVDATTEDERSRLEVPCHAPQPVPRALPQLAPCHCTWLCPIRSRLKSPITSPPFFLRP